MATNNRVTLHDLMDSSDKILARMDKMETKIMACVSQNSEDITTLKIWRANITGRLAIIVGVVTIGLSIVVDWFKKKIL